MPTGINAYLFATRYQVGVAALERDRPVHGRFGADRHALDRSTEGGRALTVRSGGVPPPNRRTGRAPSGSGGCRRCPPHSTSEAPVVTTRTTPGVADELGVGEGAALGELRPPRAHRWCSRRGAARRCSRTVRRAGPPGRRGRTRPRRPRPAGRGGSGRGGAASARPRAARDGPGARRARPTRDQQPSPDSIIDLPASTSPPGGSCAYAARRVAHDKGGACATSNVKLSTVAYFGYVTANRSLIQSTTSAMRAPSRVSPTRSPASPSGTSVPATAEIVSASGVMKIRARP